MNELFNWQFEWISATINAMAGCWKNPKSQRKEKGKTNKRWRRRRKAEDTDYKKKKLENMAKANNLAEFGNEISFFGFSSISATICFLTLHCGPEQPKIQTEVLGHSLVCSLVRSHRSLICSLRTLRCAHSFTPELMGKWTIGWLFILPFSVRAHSAPIFFLPLKALWCKTALRSGINHSLSNELGSKWASERMNSAERASEASCVEQVNVWAVPANEQTDEQVALYLRLDSLLLRTTVRSFFWL